MAAGAGSDCMRASDGSVMQDVIWIGIPAAGERAAMDHTFENVRLAEACVCKTRGQILRENNAENAQEKAHLGSFHRGVWSEQKLTRCTVQGGLGWCARICALRFLRGTAKHRLDAVRLSQEGQVKQSALERFVEVSHREPSLVRGEVVAIGIALPLVDTKTAPVKTLPA